MKKEMEEKLIRKYPKLFRQKGLSPQETCMCWGMEIGDGWYKIIEELCESIKDRNVEFTQIKEKFGGLRVYIDKGDDYTYSQIEIAEEKSYNVCEDCGEPGKLRKGGWLRTLCNNCFKK